ncbi:MAG: HWE histidine kinase domain-containing protein, partial [Pseudomonadota bacterium]
TEERISELEDELAETKGYLRTTVEELETSNEELKSSNEEMMSMNEELQSANEELSTVNEELKSKLDELAQVNADVVNFLESTQIATLFVDGRMRLRSFTPVARALFSLSEHDKGRPLLEVRTSLETERLKDAMDRILAGELRVTNRLEVNGASYNFSALPYRGTQGLLDGVVLVFEDISELVAAKEVTDEMEREVAAGQREIELLYQNAPIGMALVDAEHRYKRINDSLAAYNGVSPEDHLGRTITEVLPEIGAVLEPILDEVFNNKRFVRDHEIEVAVPTAPHQSDIFELDLYPVSDTVTGKVASAGIIARRITDARRLEADLRNAMNELQHRVKNSLATVLAVVSQTVRTTDDRKSLAEALTSRIGALASTHNLLTKAEWQAVDLRELVDQELAPYRHDQRITIEGAAMRLSPKAALTLTMVLHELVTNAAKYGPLADDGGSLEIVWRRRKDVFSLSWTEARSGEMTAPRRHGFGLRFIGRSLEHDLDGEAHFDWKPTGLACTITAPLRTICAPEGS